MLIQPMRDWTAWRAGSSWERRDLVACPPRAACPSVPESRGPPTQPDSGGPRTRVHGGALGGGGERPDDVQIHQRRV